MKKQELELLLELYDLLQYWFEKYSTNWLERTLAFKKMYKVLKLHQQALRVVIGNVPEKTVEQKAVRASFYVEDDVRYTVDFVMPEEKYFRISDLSGNEMNVSFDAVPSNAYFIGTIKL